MGVNSKAKNMSSCGSEFFALRVGLTLDKYRKANKTSQKLLTFVYGGNMLSSSPTFSYLLGLFLLLPYLFSDNSYFYFFAIKCKNYFLIRKS